MQAMPQSEAGDLAPDSGAYTNRSYHGSDLNLASQTSPRNPFEDQNEEVVFSSITQQQPLPRDRPRSGRQSQQSGRQQPPPNDNDDEDAERYEKIALPLSVAALSVGLPCCSVPATISVWGCFCCGVQDKRRRSLFAIICASVAIACGLIVIIGAVAGWSNRELLRELYDNLTATEGPGTNTGITVTPLNWTNETMANSTNSTITTPINATSTTLKMTTKLVTTTPK